MGHLYLAYNKGSGIGASIGDILKLKIDENIIGEINESQIYETELADGNHNIKLYSEGWNKNQLVGYLDENIQITDNSYFVYNLPQTLKGKGKLIKFNCDNLEDFKKQIRKKKISNTVLIIILIIICIIGGLLLS